MSGKLTGVYDALDHGNYKGCLKLCATLLKKEPNNALCKALNAFALERCGRRDEALRGCEDAHACAQSVGVDDTVLSTCGAVYRRCRSFGALCQMYEAALAKDPDSEDFATCLFFAFLRQEDFARAQQVATKLFSKHKKQKFLHWVVVAMLLQSRASGDPKVLGLASMMLTKAPINFEGLGQGEQVQFNRSRISLVLLHLDTLRMQGKVPEALELLEKCKEVIKLPTDVVEMKTRLLVQAGKHTEAVAEAKARTLKSPSDWGVAKDYIRLAFECPVPEAALRRKAPTPSGEVDVVDHAARLRLAGEALPSIPTLDDVEKNATEDEVFNAKLVFRHLLAQADTDGDSKASPAGVGRVARLARLELRRLAFCAAEAALAQAVGAAAVAGGEGLAWTAAVGVEDVAAYVADVKEFLLKFSSKPHCFFDLKPFVSLLSGADAESVLEALKGASHGDARKAAEASKTEARLQRALRRGAGGSMEEVKRLLSTPAVPAEGDDGAGDPALPPEEFLLLAVVELVDADRAAGAMGGREHLMDALALAELGVSRYPQAFHFNVLLVLINSALCLPSAMLKWYYTLEIKNIQFESLSYLAFDALCLAGCHEQIREVGRSIHGFHEDMDKDGEEAVSMAFNSCLQRAPEYLESLQFVSRSLLWGRAVVEESFCEIGQAPTWEALLEGLSRQSTLVAALKARGDDYWLQRNQDRCLLNGLNPLPLCTPLGTDAYSSQAWRRSGGPLPTASLQAARTDAACSACAIWPQPLGEAPSAASSRHEPSAVEQMLVRGHEYSPAQLTLSAAMLSLLSAVVRPEGANAEQVAEALTSARGAAQRAGVRAEVAAATDVASWGRASALRLALLACEAAGETLRCIAGQECWERVEERLAAIAGEVPAVVARILNKDRPDGAPSAAAFAFGCRAGPEMLWTLLHSCLTVVLPVALWLCTSLPKIGGKKGKEGSEALHASRVSLKNVLAAVQTALADLQPELVSAQKAAAPADVGSGLIAEAFPNGGAVAAHRAEVAQAAAEAHRRHLEKLQEEVACRAALIKSRGAFKP